MSLQERRLGAPAFAAINFHMRWVFYDGWVLTVTGRREGEAEFVTERYESLSSVELATALEAISAGMLGIH